MMEDHTNGTVRSNKDSDIGLTGEKASRSVVISNIPENTEQQKLYIHFQKTGQGGGEIESLELLDDGRAILTYEEATVAESVLKKEQEFGGVVLQLEPCKVDVFSLVSAKINPAVFKMTKKEIIQTLTNIKEKIDIKFIELCNGIWVSGDYDKIQMVCSMLSKHATSPGPRNKDINGTPLNDMHADEGEANDLGPVSLDVQPKLMYILRKEIQEIENSFNMKIESLSDKKDKAVLKPIGNAEQFEDGKEEFINLYQKNFQKMEEKRIESDIDENVVKELMGEFNVVIDRKDKHICIYGRSNHVETVMQRLQGKSRRSRKAFREETSDELNKPDTYAQLPHTLKQTLENGVTISVYQGDITEQHVDVIVNAANERLEHGGGVAAAIVRKGGHQIQHESRQIIQRYGPVPVGCVAHTSPGYLPCSIIIHAVGPQWRVHGPEGSRQLIYSVCYNSFTLANQFGARSIVLPGISSGIYGVPKEICAEMMFTAAENFSCEAFGHSLLKDICFVNIDAQTNNTFRQEFHKRYVEKRAIQFENGPQNFMSTYDDDGTNKGPQLPNANPSHGQSQGQSQGNLQGQRTMSYAAAAAAETRMKANQREMDPTSGTPPERCAFKGGFDERSLQGNEGIQRSSPTVTSSTVAVLKEKGDNKLLSNDGRDGVETNPGKAPQESKKTVKKNESNKSTTDKQSNGQNREKKGKNQTSIDSEQSAQNTPSQDQLPSTKIGFVIGFENRQETTASTKNNHEIIDKELDRQNPLHDNLSNNTDTENAANVAGHPSVVKDQQNNSARKTDDDQEQRNLSSITHQEQEQSGPEDIKTTTKKPITQNPNLHVTNISSSVPAAKNNLENVRACNKLSNETQIKRTGKGRGALAANLKNSKVPGAAVRVDTDQTANMTDADTKYPHNSKEMNVPHPKSQPPGLQVTKEGLDLAADSEINPIKVESPGEAILKELTEVFPNEKNTANKRKSNEDSPRSPKQIKEDDADINIRKGKEQGRGQREIQEEDDGTEMHHQENETGNKNDNQESIETFGGNLDSSVEDKKAEKDNIDKSKTKDYTLVEKIDETDKEKVEKNININNHKDNDIEEEKGLDGNLGQVDKPINQDNGDNNEGNEELVGVKQTAELQSAINSSSLKEDDSNKPNEVTEDDITKSTLNTHSDETQALDEPVQEDGSMNSFVVLPTQGEEQVEPEIQQASKRSENSSSSESIELVDYQDADMSFSMVNDDSSVENQEKENYQEKNVGETIVETGNEKDNSCKNIPKSEAPQEESAAVNESGKINEQEISGDHTESPTPGQQQEDNNKISGKKKDHEIASSEEPNSRENKLKNETLEEESSENESEKIKELEMKDAGADHTDLPSSEQQENRQQTSEEKKDNEVDPVKDNVAKGFVSKPKAETDALVLQMEKMSLSITPDDASNKDNSEHTPLKHQKDCSLCNEAFSSDKPERIIHGCGHKMCKGCIINCRKIKFTCPSCGKMVRCGVRQPPGGQLNHGTLEQSLDGHQDHKTIFIDYSFPAGIQGSCHPNPGSSYDELDKRRTFLPDTEEGRKVLDLLRQAFDAGLLFTVGKCTISYPHKENQIIFCDEVEHKVNFEGGSARGYPDPEYLKRVHKQLDDVLGKEAE